MAEAKESGASDELTMTNATLPMKNWRNVGRETPVAAIETILWTAAGGDTEALAGMLRLTASARQKAEEILGQLAGVAA